MTQHGQENRNMRRHPQTRSENLKLLFDLINSGQELTRADLARITGLSPSTVSSLIEALIRERLVTETGLARMQSGAGRRPLLLEIQSNGRQIPVFSLSRWGVNYVLYDLKYNVLEQRFRPLLPNGNGQAYLDVIADIADHQAELLDRRRAVGLLISYPGAYLPEAEKYMLTSLQISFAKSAVDRLRDRVGMDVYMGNSSMNLAYAEKKHLDAIGAPIDNLIYVNICDGVGAGIINNGEMLARDERITGEIGHITVVPQGRKCDCGNRGCLERYVNVNEIIARVRGAVSKDTSGAHGVALRALMENPTLDRIGSAYDAGVECVVGVIDDIAEKLFSGICCMVAITGIRLIVIGGLEAMGEGFLRRLRSLTGGECPAVLMRGVRMMYSAVSADADNIGLAQYYMDKKFYIDA